MAPLPDLEMIEESVVITVEIGVVIFEETVAAVISEAIEEVGTTEVTVMAIAEVVITEVIEVATEEVLLRPVAAAADGAAAVAVEVNLPGAPHWPPLADRVMALAMAGLLENRVFVYYALV